MSAVIKKGAEIYYISKMDWLKGCVAIFATSYRAYRCLEFFVQFFDRPRQLLQTLQEL
jgi:hypothetical protein